MNDRIKLTDAEIVTPSGIIHGDIVIADQRIQSIVPSGEHSPGQVSFEGEVVSASGMYVLPGLVDIHCDAIEKEVQPRPNTLFPLELALYEMEKKLAACGITTMYHSLSLGVGLSLRGDDLMMRMVELICRYREQRAMIRHRIHLRYEVTHFAGLPLAEQMIRAGQVDYLSLMNHAPGQGQYKRPGSFEAYVMKNQGVTRQEVDQIVAELQKQQQKIDWDRIDSLTSLARELGISVASHDDDSPGMVDDGRRFGVSVSEFPITLETATYATEKGLDVCVGSPNIVRGGSHDHNLRAMDAVHANAASIVCSDYVPSTLLPAVFTMINDGIEPHDAVNRASLNPARALGISEDTGSLEPGKKADLLLVQSVDGYPVVRKTMVNGCWVYQSAYFFGVENC